MKEYISWACEYNKNSGEGNLARIYLKSLKEKKIKLITPKYKFYLSNYIYQILGILVLWILLFIRKKDNLYQLFTTLEYSNFFVISSKNYIWPNYR